eukprot:94705-Pelagomonas_calceolata.AAC.3
MQRRWECGAWLLAAGKGWLTLNANCSQSAAARRVLGEGSCPPFRSSRGGTYPCRYACGAGHRHYRDRGGACGACQYDHARQRRARGTSCSS